MCMFIVLKALLISSATVIVRAGSHLVEPLCYGVVYCVLCFVPVLHGCVCCYVRNKALLQCLCNY